MGMLNNATRGRHSPDRGASLVEFALVAPLLILLLFGIIEIGWMFSQNLDVRHGAREGARLAAVNFPDGPGATGARTAANAEDLVAEICTRMQTVSNASVSLQSSGSVGDSGSATVNAPGDTLSGLLDWMLPAGFELTSSVDIRIEQPSTWANISDEPC